MSNHRKPSAEWSETYLDKQPWVGLRKMRIREVMIHPGLNQAIRLTYFALLGDFDNGRGYLLEELRVVCARLNLDHAKVEDHLIRLEKVGFLGKDDGGFYDNLLRKIQANPSKSSRISPNPKTNVGNSDVCPRENGKEGSRYDRIGSGLSFLDGASSTHLKKEPDFSSIDHEREAGKRRRLP